MLRAGGGCLCGRSALPSPGAFMGIRCLKMEGDRWWKAELGSERSCTGVIYPAGIATAELLPAPRCEKPPEGFSG